MKFKVETFAKPHEFVLEKVKQRWLSRYSKGFLTKLTNFILVRPSIEIVHSANWDETTGCRGEVLHRWRYNNGGLRLLSSNIDAKENIEYCYYCIDEKKKKLAISWAKMFSGALRGSRIVNYYHDGEIYEIVERNGVEEYKLVSCWME